MDDDPDGQACESLLAVVAVPLPALRLLLALVLHQSRRKTVQEGPPLTVATSSDTATPTASGVAPVPAASAAGGALPATGGGGLALMAAALLLGSGVLSYAVLRRR